MSMQLLHKAFLNSKKYIGRDWEHIEIEDFNYQHEEARKDWGLTKREYEDLALFLEVKGWAEDEESRSVENEYGMFLGETPDIWHVFIPLRIIKGMQKARKVKKASIREKVIRLAHEKPELREHLLPLIKQGHTKMKPKEVAKHLMSDVREYREYIEEMLTDFLKKNKNVRQQWSRWFTGEEM